VPIDKGAVREYSLTLELQRVRSSFSNECSLESAIFATPDQFPGILVAQRSLLKTLAKLAIKLRVQVVSYLQEPNASAVAKASQDSMVATNVKHRFQSDI
jgi:hypothetical protein